MNLIANENRIVVVTPFFLPTPGQGFNEEMIKSFPSVKMFGFETSDPGVVNLVLLMFDSYWTVKPK